MAEDKIMKPETKGGELTPLGTVLRVNRKDGIVNTMAFGLTLSKELGHVVEPYGMKPFVTAPGYNYANLAAGISVIKPSTISIGERRVANPHMERGEDGTVQRVTCRMVGFRPAIDGDWYLSDATVTLDLELYLVQDLQAKVSRYHVCGTLGVKGKPPEAWTFQDTDKQGEPVGKPKTRDAAGAMLAWFPVSGEVGLWVDLGHPEIQKAFKEHIQRRKFAERIAQSIARRNVLKCMLGVSTVQAVDGRYQVLVTKTTVANDKKGLEDMVDSDSEPKTLMGTSSIIDQSPKEPILVTSEEVTGELSDEEEAALAEAEGEQGRLI